MSTSTRFRTLRAALLGLALAAACAPLAAQDDPEAEPAAPPPRATKPAKAKPAKPGKKPAARPSPRAARPRATAPASRAARAYPLETGEIQALSEALGSLLAEKRIQPLVLQDPADDDQLSVALQVLDESLDAQLKKTGREPLTAPVTAVSQGLATLLDEIASGAPSVGEGPDRPVVATSAAADLPSVDPAAIASPGTEVAALPPPAATPPAARPSPTIVDDPEPGAVSASPGAPPPPGARVARYVLSRVVVSRDGGPDQEVPIPSGGAIRPVPLAHRAGMPPVELKLVLKLPAVIELGNNTEIAAQANVAAPGAAAELMIADEVLDTVRAEATADAATAAGTVVYSFLRRVGGVFAYQQRFAQGDGRSASTVPPRMIQYNLTDREASIEVPFAWTASAPASVSLRGRVIFAPAGRP